jgi:hypothetical protein
VRRDDRRRPTRRGQPAHRLRHRRPAVRARGPHRRRLQLCLRAPPAGPGLPDRQLPECSRNGSDTYWSYWHRAKGTARWVYSGEGAATYDPEPGDTEAWVWQEGGKRPPPDIAFGTLCPQAAAADVEPSDPPLPAATAKKTTTPQPTGSGDVPLPDLTTTPPALKPSPSKAPSTSAEASTPAATTTSAAAPTEPSPSASPVASSDDGGPPWAGLAVGVAVVALLGGAALARARRTGGSP